MPLTMRSMHTPHSSLQTYDAATDVAVVEYKGDQLNIDTSLLTDFQFRTASLYQFIGEIQASVWGTTTKPLRRPSV